MRRLVLVLLFASAACSDEVDVQTPGGRKTFEIVKLVTIHDLVEGD